MEKRDIAERAEELAKIVDPSEEELIERIALTIRYYNLKRDSLTDKQIAKTRVFLSSDLYLMVSVCYRKSLEDLIISEISLMRLETSTFEEEIEKYISEGFSRSQAIELARKTHKSKEEYLKAFEEYANSKKIVNIYDKLLKQGGQVLNSMAKSKE